MTTVLICIPCLLTGGTEIQTLGLVRALASRGRRVVTACYYEYDNAMAQRYRDAGSEVILLSEDGTRRRGWREWLFLYRGLRRCVKACRPDIAHVQYMAPGAAPCILLKGLGVRHVIATTHTDAHIYRSLRLLRFLQRRALDAFICVTLRAEEEFFGSSALFEPSAPLPPHAHVTIRNTLPTHVPLSEGGRGLAPAPVIGIVSRLERIKGADLVMPAFAKLRERRPGVRLLVAGDGSQRKEMQRQAAALHVENSVEWAGRQPQERLAAFYDRIDVFWMPSRSEGFGLSALEAMARGCPVVAAEVGGLPELLADGACGPLVPADDPQALAERTAGLLERPDEWERMSRAARARAAEFSMDRYTELMNGLYDKVCSS